MSIMNNFTGPTGYSQDWYAGGRIAMKERRITLFEDSLQVLLEAILKPLGTNFAVFC